jgi:hypothetical protein
VADSVWQTLTDWPAEVAHFEAARRAIVRVERQPVYSDGPWPEIEARWAAGEPLDSLDADVELSDWLALVEDLSRRGVTIERVRIPHDPPTRCERFQRAVETINVAAGERFRYADQQTVDQATDLSLGVELGDWWLFDESTLLALHFNHAGQWQHSTVTANPNLVAQAAEAYRTARDLSTTRPAWEGSTDPT